MFSLSTDQQPTPATAAQAAYLGKLLTRHGKAAYLQAKQRVGIAPETTLLKLSKQQAARLIRELIVNGGRR